VCFYFVIIMEFYIVENEEQNKAIVKLGLTIRKIREESTDFSQDKLALEVDLSENQIRRIEKGQTNPTIKSLLKIARALKVDIKELFR
jgi:DNA-binding XRE family transcriptional regulator